MLIAALLVASMTVGPRPSQAMIPAGTFQPLYAEMGRERVHVAAFRIDREPVTRAAFERFVRQNPSWRRSAVTNTVAESGYLADWRSDVDAGTDDRRPVTDVSWFAANAYCEWRGARLPTLNEWEYVAAASSTKRDASHDAAHLASLVATYSARAGHPVGAIGDSRPNAFGVSDLHELVWEWTSGFDGSSAHGMHTDAAHDHRASCASAALDATTTTDYAAFLRNAFRAGLTKRSTARSLGFRCASN